MPYFRSKGEREMFADFTGTLVNAAAIIAGSMVGLVFKGGIPEKVNDTLIKGLGLCVIFIGISGALKGNDMLVLIVSRYFFRFQDHPLNKMLFYGIRPVIVGLIFSAAVIVAQTAFFKEDLVFNLSYILKNFLYIINFKSVLIFAASLICLIKFKINPILMIVIAGILGVVFAF